MPRSDHVNPLTPSRPCSVIGVVPSLLIVIFFMLGGVLIFMNVSAYLFKDGYDSMVDYVKLVAESAASEMSRAPDVGEQAVVLDDAKRGEELLRAGRG